MDNATRDILLIVVTILTFSFITGIGVTKAEFREVNPTLIVKE